MNRFKEHYFNIILYDLITKFNYKNIFEIPKINKINLNIGMKHFNSNVKKISSILLLLELITGQNSIYTLSKKNKLVLKIKKGDIIGCKLTLRGIYIYFFLEKLLTVVFPVDKEFKGIFLTEKNSNIISFKIKNILNFVEIKKEFLRFKNISHVDVAIQTNCKNSHEFVSFFNSFNSFTFKKRK